MSDEFMVVSSEELAAGRVLPPEMLRDLRAVATVDTALIEGLAHALKHETGILTGERLENLINQFFEDNVIADSVIRTLQEVRPELTRQILALVDRWRQLGDKSMEMLSDSDFGSLKRNLNALVQDYPCLDLMRKAERLLRDTGNEFDDSLFICDLRPVFDRPQQRVEGFVALANLRMRYIRQNGDRDVFEIALTEDELTTLVEQGTKALNKLKVLKGTVHNLIQ